MAKHERTLEGVFAEPMRDDLVWTDVVGMLEHRGATVAAGRGSRVHIVLNGVRAVFHRPHPGKDTKRGALSAVRDFLMEAGVQPP